MRVRLIGHAKLILRVRETNRVNKWGYGNGDWVGFWLVQTRWAEWPPSALSGFYDFYDMHLKFNKSSLLLISKLADHTKLEML